MYTIITLTLLQLGTQLEMENIYILNRMEIVFQFRCRKIDQKLVNQILAISLMNI